TLALNMYAQGIDPGLDFTNMSEIAELYERVTGMHVYERQPYAGKLVFAAFSGSHQDAIAKGMQWRIDNNCEEWTVPYLPIDPSDVGREYETDVIRINSQSGKGGIGYLLEHYFGYVLPTKMREDVGYTVKAVSDRAHVELTPQEVLDVFTDKYVNINNHIRLIDYTFERKQNVSITVTVQIEGQVKELTAEGNGPLDAVSNAIKKQLGIEFYGLTYEEHALTAGSSAQAITYVSLTMPDGRKAWGVGIHDDIIASSINALFSAVNRSMNEN
ncbi:MAG: alpha-isopropylmalate synthase regulatory domain-containing protein, partial [Eubacteriales bacterium]|nr:alpha-isopropylmalate synthase regulatory domain-containing protein [Eubacteriales bacterium]